MTDAKAPGQVRLRGRTSARCAPVNSERRTVGGGGGDDAGTTCSGRRRQEAAAAAAATTAAAAAAAATTTTATTTAGPRTRAVGLCGVPAITAVGSTRPRRVVLELQGVGAGVLVHHRRERPEDATNATTAGPFSFAAPRGAGDAAGSNRFLLLADMGCTYEDGSHYHWEEPDAQNTTAHLARWASQRTGEGGDGSNASSYSEMTWFIGDLSYATGYASKWDKHMTAVEGMAAYSPLMVGKESRQDGRAPATLTRRRPSKTADAGGVCGGSDFCFCRFSLSLSFFAFSFLSSFLSL